MEFLSGLSSFIVTAIILIGIPVGVVWLIVAIVKKQSKKVPRNILIGCVAGVVVFSIIGSSAWSGTDEYTEYQVEKEEQERIEALANAEKEKQDNVSVDESSTQIEMKTQVESETETEIVETEPEINVDELTEEEYKAMCERVYIEDFEEKKVQDGQHVKMKAFIGARYAYKRYDTLAIIIDDLIQKYDLEDEYFDVGPTSREHKSSIVERPIYGGIVYLLFDKQYGISMDEYETADVAVVYGEVAQMYSGPFVIPRYMELVDGNIDNLGEGAYH